MNKKTISTILLCMFCVSTFKPNVVEAKLVNITNPGQEESASGDNTKGNAINIIKHLGVTVETSSVSTSTGSSQSGDSTQGSQGISVAFAYLTPNKKFGAVIRDNIDLDDSSGNNKSIEDDIGNVWNKSKTSSGIRGFYDNAVEDFKNSTTIKNSINISTDDIVNNRVLTQVDDNGKEFVAATLYVRWFYDIKSGRTTSSNMYIRQLPALEYYSGNSGPYMAWGDFFSSTKRLIPGSDATTSNINVNTQRRQSLANKSNLYIKSLSSATGKSYSGRYLTSDPYYGGKLTPQSYTANNKVFYEKSFEYRRYFTRGSSSSSDYFEVVYPVEHHKITKNTSKNPSGLKASVDANTIFTDSNRTEVVKYEFDVNIEPFTPAISGVNNLPTESEYTINHDKNSSTFPSSPTEEPPENKVDVWHNIITRRLVIKDKAGNEIYEKYLNSNTGKVTVYPRDVDYKNLSGYVVTIEVKYKTLSRYMEEKEVYTYNYIWDNGKGTETVYEYKSLYTALSQNSSVISSGLNAIVAHHNNTTPKTVYKYKTVGENEDPQTKEAHDVIVGPNGGDPLSPKLTVEVNPPNALTVIEGGKFDINLSFDPSGISIGQTSSNTRVWIEDLVITPIIVKAQNGDVIYEKTTPITNFTNSNLTDSIRGVTAKPSHIGEAKVYVYYTYTLVENVYGRDDIVDQFGNVTEGEEYLVRTDRTESRGVATDTFNIYSLSGVTTR